MEQLGLREVAQAAGCLPVSLSGCSAWAVQAEALVACEEDGPERGYVMISLAYEQFAIHADPVAAARTAGDAVGHGRRSGDRDLLALALAVQGRAMVRSCSVPRGASSRTASWPSGSVPGAPGGPGAASGRWTEAIDL